MEHRDNSSKKIVRNSKKSLHFPVFDGYRKLLDRFGSVNMDFKCDVLGFCVKSRKICISSKLQSFF